MKGNEALPVNTWSQKNSSWKEVKLKMTQDKLDVMIRHWRGVVWSASGEALVWMLARRRVLRLWASTESFTSSRTGMRESPTRWRPSSIFTWIWSWVECHLIFPAMCLGCCVLNVKWACTAASGLSCKPAVPTQRLRRSGNMQTRS